MEIQRKKFFFFFKQVLQMAFNGSSHCELAPLSLIHSVSPFAMVAAIIIPTKSPTFLWFYRETRDICSFFVGGSPYPRMDGRKIGGLLQEGYRMPKPQHVDDKL